MSTGDELALPSYVNWPIFPFEGELRIKNPTWVDADPPRSGEPGGQPCHACADEDDAFIWVDDHWRLRARAEPSSVPVVLFLETREHMDLDGLDDERAAELGVLIARIERAVRAIGGIGRVQIYRWADGAQHFHLWFYARPAGSMNLLGFGMPLWEPILPAIADDVWNANLVTVAHELARMGGRALV